MGILFDVLKDGKTIKTGVETPFDIDGLTPNTQYDNYSLVYTGETEQTPLSFKTTAQAVSGVSLDKTTLSLETGNTATVKATVAPADATDKAVTFKSADATIATVDNNGKINAIKAGTVDIIVTTHDGAKTAKLTLTVTDPAPTEPEAPAEGE